MKKEGGREVGSAVVVTAKIPFCQTLLPKKVPGFHNPMKDIEAEPHGRDKRQMPNVVFSIWHSGDFSLARSGQTPNAKH